MLLTVLISFPLNIGWDKPPRGVNGWGGCGGAGGVGGVTLTGSWSVVPLVAGSSAGGEGLPKCCERTAREVID